MQQSSCVRSCMQAVGMWQVLLEEGVLNQGETACWLCMHTCTVCIYIQLWLCCCDAVDQELSFQDKCLFYRFLDDEQEDAPFPSEEERKESQEELQDTLLLLSQIGPDAHMRMILRKQYEIKVFSHTKVSHLIGHLASVIHFLLFSPSERTADDLEIIYEELLHIKALTHLSTTVSTDTIIFPFAEKIYQTLRLFPHIAVCNTYSTIYIITFVLFLCSRYSLYVSCLWDASPSPQGIHSRAEFGNWNSLVLVSCQLTKCQRKILFNRLENN